MAGNGPAPKDPDKRVRRNADPVPLRVIEAPPVKQPELPKLMITGDGEMKAIDWPDVTREWWSMWGESPLSADFTDTDWSELAIAANLHARFWLGDTKLAAELRLRTAKFGATKEDRLRLRVTLKPPADPAADGRPVGGSRSRDRYRGLTAG